MISELVHGKCGKKVQAVEVLAVVPQTRYVLEEEDRKFYETAIDESPSSAWEEYVCQECGQPLGPEEVERLLEMMADD